MANAVICSPIHPTHAIPGRFQFPKAPIAIGFHAVTILPNWPSFQFALANILADSDRRWSWSVGSSHPPKWAIHRCNSRWEPILANVRIVQCWNSKLPNGFGRFWKWSIWSNPQLNPVEIQWNSDLNANPSGFWAHRFDRGCLPDDFPKCLNRPDFEVDQFRGANVEADYGLTTTRSRMEESQWWKAATNRKLQSKGTPFRLCKS